MTYTSAYPTGYSTTYVKATNAEAPAHQACNPALSVTSTDHANNSHYGDVSTGGSQRFHMDLGSAVIIRRIYYENNFFSTGTNTDNGWKTITFWGSNSATAFAELTYATNTDWVQLTIDSSQCVQHPANSSADPHYILVNNSVSYRYYGFKVADGWGSGTYLGIRRIELQTQDGYVPAKGSFLLNFV